MDDESRTVPRGAALLRCLGLLMVTLMLAARSVAATAPGLQETVLMVMVNGVTPAQTVVALRDAQGRLWLDSNAFQALRLKLPGSRPQTYQGDSYFAVEGIPGARVRVDETQQSAAIEVPAAAFMGTVVAADTAPLATLTGASPGAFLNYQLSDQHLADTNTAAAWTELGIFAPQGLLTNTTVVRTGGDDLSTGYDGSGRAVRLDTTYRYDLVSRLETLTLGDAISNGGNWGDALRFAGVHWGTDFGIRPDLVTTPRLSVSGAAVVPSTVDVLINGQRVSTQQLPPGPFTVDNLPPLNGAGDVSLVVRDALGREQILTQPFYSGASLLAKGLSDYSIDLGAVRENYALTSNDYGSLLATQTYRRGLSDALTLEEHTEYLDHGAYAGGLDAALRTGTAGILTLTLAEGGEAGSHGSLTGIGFQHSGERLNFNVSTSYADAGFHQVGDDVLTTVRFKQRSLAQIGLNLQRAGSLSLAYVMQTYRAQPQQQTVSLTHNLTVSEVGAFSLTVSRATGYGGSTSAYLMFTRALGARRAVSMTAVGNSGNSGDSADRNQVYATLIDNPPAGPGSGYQLTASTDGDYDGLFRSQFTASDIEVEAARNSGSPGQRALLEGAFTLLDGQFSATRSVTGSFAVVDAGGIANLPVYVENQLVTRTNDSGRALLPDLRSFETNRIEVEPTELPLDTTIDTRSVTVSPAYRSGVIVRFPVAKVRGGTLRLVDEKGAPLPPGTRVLLQGKEFPVGLDGMTYVTGYDHGMSATANWPGGACRFRLPPPPSHEPLPDVGTIECRAGEAR